MARPLGQLRWCPAVRRAALIAGLGALIGCGASRPILPRAMVRPLPSAACTPQYPSSAPFSGEAGVYRAGAVTLAVGQDLAQLPRAVLAGTTGEEAIAVVVGDRPVSLSVDRASQARLSLQFTRVYPGSPIARISNGRSAVRFPACGQAVHRFFGGILFSGEGCVRLHVQPSSGAATWMLIPIGDSLRGCPTADRTAPLSSAALPYVGVACREANSIACDRVGVGVRPHRPATLIVVQLAGRIVALSPPEPPDNPRVDDLWLGYLYGAGLRHGPLDVHLAPGGVFWFGNPGVYPRVRVTAFFPDGGASSIAATVSLSAGFG